MLRRYLIGAGGLALFLAGMATGYGIYRPKQAKPDNAYKPEVVQQDGSRIVERRPQTDANPTLHIPKGATVERIVTATLVPDSTEPMRIELVTVKMPDESSRVIAKAEGGQIIGAVDVPVVPRVTAKTLVWSAGAIYRMPGQTWGVYLDRDYGPFRVGCELAQEREPISGIRRLAATAKFGIRW